MTSAAAPVRASPAPVLTLWAAVVAERLGHKPDAALSLASAVAGTAAGARARRLDASGPGEGCIALLGRAVPVARAPDGSLRAVDAAGQPADPEPVRRYLARAFGARLAEVRAAMEARAASLPPEELNCLGFRLYEAFRPAAPEPAPGGPRKGVLHLDRILRAVG